MDVAAAAASAAASPPPQPLLHVSLSRTVALRAEDAEVLVPRLRQELRSAKQSSYHIELSGLRSFTNDERKRTFLSVDLAAGRQQVLGQIAAVDRCFTRLELPAYYQDPQPHVSIGWLLGDEQARLDAVLRSAEGVCLAAELVHTLQVRRVVCRVGQKDHVVWSAVTSS